jgi:hypothetical protein
MRARPFPVEAAAALIRDSSTLATPLLAIVLTAYGDEIFGNEQLGIEPIDPIELYARITEDFRAQLTEAGENRLQAMLMAVATDGFYEDPLVFTSVAKALSSGDVGELPDGIMEDVTLPEAVWAVYEVSLNRDDDIGLHPLVLALITGAADAEAEDQQDEALPHHERFVHHMKIELAAQLQSINVQFPFSQLQA